MDLSLSCFPSLSYLFSILFLHYIGRNWSKYDDIEPFKNDVHPQLGIIKVTMCNMVIIILWFSHFVIIQIKVILNLNYLKFSFDHVEIILYVIRINC